MISEQDLQSLAVGTFSQPPYVSSPCDALNPLPTNASPEQVQQTIANARNTVVSRNFVSTFRCLAREYMTGATPLPANTQNLFTAISWKTIHNRRVALRNETARNLQCSVDDVSNTHPRVTQHMKVCACCGTTCVSQCGAGWCGAVEPAPELSCAPT